MIVESACIIILILAISVVFMRQRRFDYAKATGILLIVPACNLLAAFISKPLSRLQHVDREDVMIIAIILGLIISCILLGLRCIHIKGKRLRLAYLIVNGVFIGLLSLIFIYNLSIR